MPNVYRALGLEARPAQPLAAANGVVDNQDVLAMIRQLLQALSATAGGQPLRAQAMIGAVAPQAAGVAENAARGPRLDEEATWRNTPVARGRLQRPTGA